MAAMTSGQFARHSAAAEPLVSEMSPSLAAGHGAMSVVDGRGRARAVPHDDVGLEGRCAGRSAKRAVEL
jgi:hypothetical protein